MSCWDRHEPGLGAVWAGLLGLRRVDRYVQGGVPASKSGGEDVGGPEVGARDEARNLGLSGVVTGLSGNMNEGGDRVVATSSLAQGATVDWTAPESREPVWQAAQGTGSLCPAHPNRSRTESTFSSGSSTGPC